MSIVFGAIALAALAMLAACAADREPAPMPQQSTTRVAEPTDVIDQRLMLALSQAKNLHHKAKIYISDGNVAAATASVREILSLEFPAGAPEAEDVRNDARALLGKLLVGQGDLDEAMHVVQEGIAGSQRKSFFVANLYTVEGEIHEARASKLPAGDPHVVDEKHAAIEAFDRSNQIDVELQKQLVEHQ
ncbi:MAG TPA: hypothetical protein VMJ10_12520 [Kofleriaceae bacterium]|nr:hypothetical protein [Kofleriaceae bacterium]